MIKMLLSLISVLLVSILIILVIPYFKNDEVLEINKKDDTKIVKENKNKEKKTKNDKINKNDDDLSNAKIAEKYNDVDNNMDSKTPIYHENDNNVNVENEIEYSDKSNKIPQNESGNNTYLNETDSNEENMNEEEILQRRMEERNPHGDSSAWGIELDDQQLEYKDYLNGEIDTYDQSMSDDQKQYVHESLPYLQK
ncbi:hypothetical protein [Mammaliicoccus sciuri]|uniref:hypothetical protein n=1 Tax=Mammaliicoccus sciuri TaxID=1296 RepID=UPI002DBA9A69|nr:hypothetical protein [Mammaliicoccus sciuri]MEB7394286.1 hypothetical protein [Mammaliicoccus sciuri]MEB8142363.1 hypothetical protein [Mammaliicoccus sciuri]